tara:strand:+ start:903 stop:1217 length:315 start_codon:yes stop_codon:yes gene_type:complete
MDIKRSILLNKMNKPSLIEVAQHFNKISYIKGIHQMKKKELIVNLLMDTVTLDKALNLMDKKNESARDKTISKIRKLQKKAINGTIEEKTEIFNKISKILKKTI